MDISEQEQKKKIAEESPKTRKAREKLKRQLEALDKKVTPQALEKKAIEIQQWIDRNASVRVPLKTKSISLFDENQNAAELSQRVSLLAEQIKKEFVVGSEEEGQMKLSKLKNIVTN